MFIYTKIILYINRFLYSFRPFVKIYLLLLNIIFLIDFFLLLKKSYILYKIYEKLPLAQQSLKFVVNTFFYIYCTIKNILYVLFVFFFF